MPRRISFVCDDDIADRVEALARQYGVSEQEALRQVVQAGLEDVDGRARR